MTFDAEVERFQGLLAEGYGRWDDNDPIGACGPWLEAGPRFLSLADETGAKSIRKFDQKLSPEWLAFNRVQDPEAALWNAGMKDASLTFQLSKSNLGGVEESLLGENRRREAHMGQR